ncbi:MAG: hypothetical protein IJ308_08955 [Clostridia bacterium]|nr:hypothetical protein [Clostridia bacterium]
MTQQQQQAFNQILNYLQSLPKGTRFSLDKKFYANAYPNNQLLPTDKRVIGKEFFSQVSTGKIQYVDLDHYKKYGCKYCDYKDSSNKIHYITK